jgi:probable HAF family extracellular repeat protein
MIYRAHLSVILLVLVVANLAAQTPTKTASVTFTTVDFPGAAFSNVTGINSFGDMVGNYSAIYTGIDGHGFLYRNGLFTSIDYPGAFTTGAGGINDSELIVGTVQFDGGLVSNGFLYEGQTFTLFAYPGQPNTGASSINNAGTVVGGAGNSGSATHAFKLQNGVFQGIDPPINALIKGGGGINNFDEIAILAALGKGNTNYGFVLHNGKFKPIVFPGAAGFTEALGINDKRIVVGWYFVAGQGSFGFAYQNGRYVSLAFPGATDTYATAINNAGQIAGEYVLPDSSTHGFVTSPITDADFQ